MTFSGPWPGAEGAWRLVSRVWQAFETGAEGEEAVSDPAEASLALRRATHRTIKAVGEAIEGFRFNSAVARLYEFVAALSACPPSRRHGGGARGRPCALWLAWWRPSLPISARSAGQRSAARAAGRPGPLA